MPYAFFPSFSPTPELSVDAEHEWKSMYLVNKQIYFRRVQSDILLGYLDFIWEDKMHPVFTG